jgi:hypothetical protein
MWILINRLLCMLQPLEELQDCNAKAAKSIDTDYSSLPPQLVVFQALKSKHFVLAAVCAMALLANLLAVAFSGLFNQASINLQHVTAFQRPYDVSFLPVNGSVGPEVAYNPAYTPMRISGAYQGGDGMDQFLIAESNWTRNTSLPAWTDNTMFYIPTFDEAANDTHQSAAFFASETDAIGATLDCEQISLDNKFEARLKNGVASMNISISNGPGSVQCSNLGPVNLPPCTRSAQWSL